MDASCTLGVLIYSEYAELCHLPSILMVASGIPQAAAFVAAPILKLFPLYFARSMPHWLRAVLSESARMNLVSGASIGTDEQQTN